MTKTTLKNLAEEAIVLLREMFGEGIDFDCTEYYKSNEALTGIALKLPGCSSVPVVCLDDMPDNATTEDIANIAATVFQDTLRNFRDFPALPEMTRETILANVVVQALSRKRNRQLLKSHPHITFLDLAGIFWIPVGPYKRNSLTTSIRINGAALILFPDILEQIGEKAGMDYYLIPSSIHELLVAKDDGLVTAKMLKEIVHDGSRTDAIVRQEDVLSDNVYFYSCAEKSLKIV